MDRLAQLGSDAVRRLGLPEFAMWFWYQEGMLAKQEKDASGRCFAVSWDKSKGGNKLYGLFETAGTYYEGLATCKNQSKLNGYEFIPQNRACKLYLDVEWVGALDSEHARLKKIVRRLREGCRDEFKLDPAKVYVCASSRKSGSDGQYKNSYHVVCPSLVFARNNCGEMKRFVEDLFHAEEFKDLVEGKSKSCVDLAVYTKNRVIRTPFCSKFGAQAPFIRISGDPIDVNDAYTSSYTDIKDPEAWGPFILTELDDQGSMIIPECETTAELKPDKKRKASSDAAGDKSAKTNEAASGSAGRALVKKSLPFRMEVLQELLVAVGDHVTTLTNETHLPGEGKWMVQGDQKKRTRECLSTPGETHSSNNCILFVTDLGSGQYGAESHCTAQLCSHKHKVPLGTIKFDMAASEWIYELDPRFVPEPEPVEEEIVLPTEEELNKAFLGYPRLGNDPAMNTYELIKQRHDLRCAGLLNPAGQFVIIEFDIHGKPTGGYQLANRAIMMTNYEGIDYYEKDEKADGGWACKQNFIGRWLHDADKKKYNRIVNRLDLPKGPGLDYNTWTGFHAEKLPPVDPSLVEDLIKPFITHLHMACMDQNQEHTDWVLDWFAHMIQSPGRNSKTALLFYGPEGCGKGLIPTWHRIHVLGMYCTSQTSVPEHDLFGKHAQMAHEKLFIQVDELTNTHAYKNPLKNLITEDYIRYEKKGADTTYPRNYANVLFTTNNPNALQLSTSCRRHAMFECKNVHADKWAADKYFKELADYMDHRDDVKRAWFQFLRDRRIKHQENFQTTRPETEYYRATQQSSIPVVSRFLSKIADESAITTAAQRYDSAEFYQLFAAFFDAGRYKFDILNKTSFGREMTKIEKKGIDREKVGGVNFYVVSPAVLKEYLISIKEYDEKV
jgi:hypothetical protein